MADPKEAGGPGAYVRAVTESTQAYLQEMRQENEGLRQGVTELLAQKTRLEQQVAEIQDELIGFRERQRTFQTKLAALEQERRYQTDRHQQVQRQTTSLTNLYVASHRLHEAVDLKHLCDIIFDIVGNMVGSEDAALYEVDASRKVLRRLSQVGARPVGEHVAFGEGTVGEVAVHGATVLGEAPLVACIPLMRTGRVLGVLAIHELLPHKLALEAVDHELIALLASQGGLAFRCAGLEAGARGHA